MLDHIALSVADSQKSRNFYEAALAPLGITLLASVTPEQTGGGAAYGFGDDGRPYFWVGDNQPVVKGAHVAFAAKSHDEVQAFYDAALAAGGRDNGTPGPRPHFGPDYYAAFVFDLDGANIEAVCRTAG